MKQKEKVFLIFDTETTGLFNTKDKPHLGIIKARNPMKYPEDYPRVFQLAFILMKESGEIIKEFSEFIKPDDWEIPNEPFWIEHGYSTEQCEKLGVPMKDALDLFISCMDQCDYLVAHNIDFDRPVIMSELSRYKTKFPEGFKKPGLLCTMKTTINYVQASHSEENIERYPFLKFSNKFPKLIELHEKLFNSTFDGAHDALVDVRATFRCLLKLRDLKILNF